MDKYFTEEILHPEFKFYLRKLILLMLLKCMPGSYNSGSVVTINFCLIICIPLHIAYFLFHK